MSSSLISRKPSTTYANSGRSSTQPSVSLVYRKGNYSGSSLVTGELKPTRKRTLPHGHPTDDQGYPEAHTLYGGPKQIYLATWRMRPLLQIAQTTRQVPVDRGGETGTGRSQASFAVAPHPNSSTTRRETVTLHHHDYSHRHHDNHGGTPGGRPYLRCAAACLLHQ
jgi:hypothetical protein